MPKTKKKNKSKPLTVPDSPIIIADSSSPLDRDRKPATAPGLYISHESFRGAIEVTVNDPGYHAAWVQPPSPGLKIPLTVPWILAINNSVHISSIKLGTVHVHFNSTAYNVGVYQGNPAFFLGGQALTSVTLLNDVTPNANLTNLQVYQGTGSGATVQILFEADAGPKRRKK